jgi:uncharacterized protein YuzE
LHIRVRGGEVEKMLKLAEREFGAYLDVDREGNVMGVEFFSLKEFTELISRFGEILELCSLASRTLRVSPKVLIKQ